MICIECGEYHVTSNENASFNHICNGGFDTVKMKQGIEILTKKLNEKCGPTTAAARPPPPLISLDASNTADIFGGNQDGDQENYKKTSRFMQRIERIFPVCFFLLI